MRVIIEGGAGRGKTTLAKALAEVTAVPVYRPFRGERKHITKDIRENLLQMIGLSVNGWEEDLYVADFLANVPTASVILDRALPSALAYNERADNGERLGTRERQLVVEMWAERILAARATLVLLVGSEEVRAQRCPDRGGPWEEQGIYQAMIEVRRAEPTIPVWRINTDNVDPVEMARAIARQTIVGSNSNLIEVVA